MRAKVHGREGFPLTVFWLVVSQNLVVSLGPYRVQTVPTAPPQLLLTLTDPISDEKLPKNIKQSSTNALKYFKTFPFAVSINNSQLSI